MKNDGYFGRKARLAHLKELIGEKSFNKISDFGCKEGYLLHNLDAKEKNGYDMHPVEEFDDIRYAEADIACATSENNDLIVCSEVIEHMRDDVEAIRNIHKSLKIGGFVFLTTLNKNTGFDKSEIDKKRGHLRRYGPELKVLMEKEGFSTIRFYPFRGKHYYDCKNDGTSYYPKMDGDSQGFASGWIYFGVKK